jgi:hypothetical protein
MNHRRAALKSIVLAASILVRYDTMEVLVYVQPGGAVQSTDEFVAQACEMAQALDLALPTPYRIEWRKQLASGAVLRDESPAVTGMLTSATCART